MPVRPNSRIRDAFGSLPDLSDASPNLFKKGWNTFGPLRSIEINNNLNFELLILDSSFAREGNSLIQGAHQVANISDRPIQVGSHYHFFESNNGLEFDRQRSIGMRLDIPAGTAIRFEPGDQREVDLVPYAGDRKVFGFNGLINDSLH